MHVGVRKPVARRKAHAKRMKRELGGKAGPFRLMVKRCCVDQGLRRLSARAKLRSAREVVRVCPAEDALDLAVARDRLANPAGPNIPLAQVKRNLGL